MSLAVANNVEVKPERSGGRSIKHQVELGHLILVIRNVTRFCAFKYLSSHDGKAAKQVYEINAVAEATTNIDELTIGIDRGQTVSGREISNELTMRYMISCITNDETVNAVSLHRLDAA
jgi:hypothetical protein